MVTVAPPHPWVYALRLPHDPRAVRVARVTVRAALDGHGMQDAADVVELLTSELVTNAYRHTKGPASLRLTGLSDGRLRVGVWDSDPRIPAPFSGTGDDPAPLAPSDAETGRGLCLVREYADSWGGWALGDDTLRRGAREAALVRSGRACETAAVAEVNGVTRGRGRMSKRQTRKMLQLMASGEPVELTSAMASVKKLARLAFTAQQFGYEYADVRQGGGNNSQLKMLIVPDPSPQARARAAQNRAQYPNAGDGVSVPPLVPDAFELLKARINFDLTGKSGEKRMGYGAIGVSIGCAIVPFRLGGRPPTSSSRPSSGSPAWASSASAWSSTAGATPGSRPGSRRPDSFP